MLSCAVTGVIPPPETVTVFPIVDSAASGANSLRAASYTTVAFPPAGTLIPLIVKGGPAFTAGAACNTPFV